MSLRPTPRRAAQRRRYFGRFYGEEVLAAMLFALCLLLLSAQQLLAHEYKAGSLLIDHPWARATPAGSDMGAGFLAIHNSGTTPDRLLSAAAPFARRVEIQERAMKDGLMRMMPIRDGLEIPAGGTLLLVPSGQQIVFIALNGPLKEGAMMDATLTFEKAGKVQVAFRIEATGATALDKMHHPLSQ